jgi:ribosomal protein L29
VNIALGNQTPKDSKDSTIEDLTSKLAQHKKELNDLKINYTMKCKENENLTKEN